MWNRVSTEGGWIRCSRPFSFYRDLIERYWAGGPSEASAAPIHRVCTLARKMGARSIVIEEALVRADVTDEIAHLEECSDVEVGNVSAVAITFLASPPSKDVNYGSVKTTAVIGQVVIVTFPIEGASQSYIFEAIWRIPGPRAGAKQLLNNHVPIRRDLTIEFGGVAHTVPAAHFCQQNGVSTICSHSAVRMLVRTLTGAQVTARSLNELWCYDPQARKVTSIQIREALREHGLRCLSYDPDKSPDGRDRTWDLPALLADSGSASLLMLADSGTEHVIPVLGHTMNSDEWHPIGAKLFKKGEEDVSSSSLWTDHLIVHDDLLGPYYCLSKAGLLPGREAPVKPKLAMAILPPGVNVSPVQAEDFARQILGILVKVIETQKFGRGRWWRHLADRQERRVFRTTLLTRDEYLATLPDRPSTELKKKRLAASLPERMWMAEVSVPNVFLANKAKLGEILVSASAFPAEEGGDAVLETMLGFRLPSLLCWRDPDGGPRDFVMTRWPERGHRAIHAPGHHDNWW